MKLLTKVAMLFFLASIPLALSADISPACEDKHSVCPFVKRSCKLFLGLKTLCPKTCGTCVWSQWVKGKCSVTCGRGNVKYTRSCLKGTCVGAKTKFETCEEKDCPKYRYEVVGKSLYWQEARSYCQERGGDLIQFNPKVYSLKGRYALAASLNLPMGNEFHTGIRRDPSNYGVWRRVSDGVQVKLEGWQWGHPYDWEGQDYLYWNFYGYVPEYEGMYTNTIFSRDSLSSYVICEFY